MTVRTLATTVLGAAAATLLATAASAAVTGGAITGGTASPGTFVILTPPFAVGNNNQQVNNRLFAWNEKQNVLLTAPLVTDLGGTILAGTRVASHGVVFDPVATRTVKGFVTFDRPILGVIWQTSRLVATDGLLGLPTITYNSPSARGLEARGGSGERGAARDLHLDQGRVGRGLPAPAPPEVKSEQAAGRKQRDQRRGEQPAHLRPSGR
ncbi:MAG: hypothetical protein ACK4MT_03825 [Thermaurantiacus tibetensis]